MTSHARISPSSFKRRQLCLNSLAMEKNFPDTSSPDAELGTVYHELVSRCLIGNGDPWRYNNYVFTVINGKIWEEGTPLPEDIKTRNEYAVDQQMIEYALESIQVAHDFTPAGATRLIEERVNFSSTIGVPESFGTSDVIIISENELAILDWKHGFHQVDAERNPQLMLYALGAYSRLKFIHDFKRVRMVIHQPRIQHLSEWDCSVEELLEFGREAKIVSQKAIEIADGDAALLDENFNPSEAACHWCKAKGTCKALADKAMNLIADDFVDLTKEEHVTHAIENAIEVVKEDDLRLTNILKAEPLVEILFRGARETAFQKMMSGHPVKDFKLVRGKQGNRRWSNEQEAEAAMKEFGVSKRRMFTQKFISPTDAEKLVFKTRPKQWKDMQAHITRSEGSLSVAPISDKREAVVVGDISADFENLETGGGE